MLPGSAVDKREKRKHPRPPCGIKGHAAAWARIETVEHPTQRDTLDALVRQGGVQGTAAMVYLTSQLLWRAGLRDYCPPKQLKRDVVAYIDRRAAELLEPHRGTGLFPRLKKP